MFRSFFEFFSGGSSGDAVDRSNPKPKATDYFKFGDDSAAVKGTASGPMVPDRRISGERERRVSFNIPNRPLTSEHPIIYPTKVSPLFRTEK